MLRVDKWMDAQAVGRVQIDRVKRRLVILRYLYRGPWVILKYTELQDEKVKERD